MWGTAPTVAVATAHVLDEHDSLQGIAPSPWYGIDELGKKFDMLLKKYSDRLTPQDAFIAGNVRWVRYGYHERGLLLAFEHSVPDATLPIFWSSGKNGWTPLVERR